LQMSTEPRKMPLKSQGLKSQAVNGKDLRQSALNKDLKKIGGEVREQANPIRIQSTNNLED
jgi:hypothetical protein